MALAHADVGSFNKALGEFATEVGFTIEYAALREAALMSRDAIIFTPPLAFGGGGGETKQAELVGKAAVERDIRSLFVVPSEKIKRTGAALLLHNISVSAKRRNFGEFIDAHRAAQGTTFDAIIPNKIVEDSDRLRAYKKAQNFFNKSAPKPTAKIATDLAPIHNRWKSVSRRGKTKITTGQGDYYGKFIVSSISALKSYIKSRQAEVGKLKAGWWNVITSLPKPKKKGVEVNFGRKGVAAYVKNFPSNGYQSLYVNPRAVNLKFGNRIGNADGMAAAFEVESLIYGTAITRIERDTEQMLNRDTTNFNSGRIR